MPHSWGKGKDNGGQSGDQSCLTAARAEKEPQKASSSRISNINKRKIGSMGLQSYQE